jgi:hypothetical protein
VTYSDWIEPDEGEISMSLRGPLDANPAEWVWAVEHDDLDACGCGRLHGERCGPHVRVVTRADVLEVDDDRVEIGKPVRLGAEVRGVVTIERVQGNLGAVLTPDALHVLRRAGKAVLGAEQCCDLRTCRLEHGSRRAQSTVYTRGVG